MNKVDFKKVFGIIAKKKYFDTAFGCWYKESNETIVVLELQKSNYGNYYELNIKIYIQGVFEKKYSINKNLLKNDIGDIFKRQPLEFNSILDLDNSIEDENRLEQLEKLFNNFIMPLVNKGLSRNGIRDLASKEEIYLLPAVKKELDRLC